MYAWRNEIMAPGNESVSYEAKVADLEELKNQTLRFQRAVASCQSWTVSAVLPSGRVRVLEDEGVGLRSKGNYPIK